MAGDTDAGGKVIEKNPFLTLEFPWVEREPAGGCEREEIAGRS